MRLNLGCGPHVHPDWVNVDSQACVPGVRSHDLRQGIPFPDASAQCVYASHVIEHFPRRRAPLFLAECHRVLKAGGVARIVVPDLEALARLYLTHLEGAVAGDAGAQARYEWILLELLDQMVRTMSGGEMFAYWAQDPMPGEEYVLARAGRDVRGFLERYRGAKDVHPTVERLNAALEAPDMGAYQRLRESGELHMWMYDRYSLGKLLAEAGFADVKICRADESAIPGFAGFNLDTEEDGSVRKPESLFMEGIKRG